MSDEYYLKIGGTEVFNEQVIADLSASEEEKKNKADAILSERLKEARVRIGTLLKTDNVSFLFGAGASMKAGGVGLAAIPYEIEKALHEKAQASTEDQDTSWLSLFYETISVISGQPFNLAERKQALAGNLSEIPKIPINLEDYLTRLHIWRAGMYDFAEHANFYFAPRGTLAMSKDRVDHLITEINRSLNSLGNLPRRRQRGFVNGSPSIHQKGPYPTNKSTACQPFYAQLRHFNRKGCGRRRDGFGRRFRWNPPPDISTGVVRFGFLLSSADNRGSRSSI